MPGYDYRCLDCHKRFTLFMSYTEYGSKVVECPYCGGTNLQRRIGRIRLAHSESSRMETLADPGSLDGLDEDPRSLGRMMRQMSSETGEEMGPEFDEVVSRLESGQSPEEIEKQLPDLGTGPGGDEMGGFGGGDDLDF